MIDLTSITEFIQSLFFSFNTVLKLFFNDMPLIFGLRLGWWIVIFSIVGLIVGGASSD